MTCGARRQCDQMVCNRCGLRWDVDDQDIPECKPWPFKVKPRSTVEPENPPDEEPPMEIAGEPTL